MKKNKYHKIGLLDIVELNNARNLIKITIKKEVILRFLTLFMFYFIGPNH